SALARRLPLPRPRPNQTPLMEEIEMKKWSLVLTLPIVLWATTAFAALVTYSSEAAWSAAVGSFVTESFNNSGLQPTTGVVTSAGPIDGFYGWTSDAAFDSFTIKAGNNAGVAETFELEHLMMAPTSGTVTPTVEPATLVLVGTGLAGLRFVRWKLPFQS